MGGERRVESAPDSEAAPIEVIIGTTDAKHWLKMMAAMHKSWLSLDEAAFYCGVSSRQFRKYRREFKFSAYKGMGKLLFSRRDLDALIEATQVIPTTGASGEGISPALRAQSHVDMSRYPKKLVTRLEKLKSRED